MGAFWSLFYGDDGARALHTHDMLDGAADASARYNFGATGLPGAANLPLHREPAFIADRARSGDFRA